MTVNPKMQRSRFPTGHPQAAAAAGRVVEAAVAAAFAVPMAELRAPTRGAARIAFARQSAMYLAHVALGLTLSTVGHAFGRDPSTASHACRLVVKRRKDPVVDCIIADLEHVVAPMRGRFKQGAVRS